MVEFLDEFVVACFYEGVLACLDNNNEDNFDVCIINVLDDFFNVFFSHTLWNRFLREPWVKKL